MTKEKTAEDGQPEPEAEKPKEKTKKAKPEETASRHSSIRQAVNRNYSDALAFFHVCFLPIPLIFRFRRSVPPAHNAR